MTDRPIDLHSASDYAGMTIGPLSFYYGYEWGERDDGGEQWGFRAKNTGVEILSFSTEDLIERAAANRCSLGNGEPVDMLLAGIALYLQKLMS